MKHLAYAPGKVIITGEHFVVHGAVALAAAVERGVTAEASLSESTRLISEPLGLESTSSGKIPSPLRPLSAALAETVRFLDEKRNVTITIRSNLPSRAGLGSSASVAVATVSAAASAFGHILPKDKVFQLASISEKHVHGRPSGIDATVSVFGGLVLFKKNRAPEHIFLEHPVDFVVGVSGLERRTSEMIGRVSAVRDRLPQLFKDLSTTSSRMAELSARCLEEGDLKTTGSIVNFHHSVLRWLGISTPPIEKLVKASLAARAWGAKITGAGGGGSMFAVPRIERVTDVMQSLAKISQTTFVTRIPTQGVKVWREKS